MKSWVLLVLGILTGMLMMNHQTTNEEKLPMAVFSVGCLIASGIYYFAESRKKMTDDLHSFGKSTSNGTERSRIPNARRVAERRMFSLVKGKESDDK